MGRALNDDEQGTVVERVGVFLSNLGWQYSLQPKPSESLADLMMGVPGRFADMWTSPEGHLVEIDDVPMADTNCAGTVFFMSRYMDTGDGEGAMPHVIAAIMPHNAQDIEILRQVLSAMYALPTPQEG